MEDPLTSVKSAISTCRCGHDKYRRWPEEVLMDAADEIERLRNEVARLKEERSPSRKGYPWD